LDNKKILEFPVPIDKRWEEINRMLVEALENPGLPVDVSVTIRKWMKEIYEKHWKQLRIPISIKTPSASPELQKKIEESMKESTNLFIKECDKQMFDMFVVMIITKIECEKVKSEQRFKSFLHD
jgi:hypothetical protein